tara:strand:+ start:837 stop:1868 length:1032 start_codon:yes stop_codon:yes gene_type:complete
MAKKKKALITGITGQDGAYLAEFLIEKGYKVYGTFRRTSNPNFGRLKTLNILSEIELIPFDLLDQSSIINTLKLTNPDEIYNLAAQSFVGASFEQPSATGEITGLGLTRLIDSIRVVCPNSKFYQASSSEMFGGEQGTAPQNEQTPFCPRSPYAAAKLYSHWVTINYREAYNMFACCGILFNHESPLRGLEFVTRKITYAVAKIKQGKQDKLFLGNLDAKRDWGFAKDYVEAMWLMLQQKKPIDYVIATGQTNTVREFANYAFNVVGLNYKDYVEIDKKFFRPTEVDILLGDPTKAQQELNWNPNKTSFKELVELMVESDMKLVEYNLDVLDPDYKELPHFKE